jgi:Cryptococcal mannosyltransferase 1
VESGYHTMASSRAEVCILCRDAVSLLPNLTRRMRTLAASFKSTHVSVIENDSKDDTVEKIRRWAEFEKEDGTLGLHIDVEHHNLMLERPPILNAGYDDAEYAAQRASRYHRLSLLRNRCLMQAMKRTYTDYLIVIDVDDDVDDGAGDLDGIAHSYGLRNQNGKYDWEVTCANSVLHQPPGVTASLYRNVSEPVPDIARRWVFRDSLAFRDSNFNLNTFRFHERRIHTPYDEPYYVQSCFGGLAIYDLSRKTTDWHACSYEAFRDDDCEHVSFHNCLRSIGWRILFNPRMTVQYH